MSVIIDWNSTEERLLFNPRLPDEEILRLKRCDKPKMPGHIWLTSSGTSDVDEIKLIALSKEAFLVSANAVNEHLEVTGNDVWFNVLPTFHVGGLSIYARAFLSNSKLVDISHFFKWNPKDYVAQIKKNKATLSSLVPAQIYDIVQKQIKAPESLRALVVGGGSIREGVYVLARRLGWPVLPTYGMTEACSQVATCDLETLNYFNEFVPAAKILPHIQLKTSQDGTLCIKGQSLCTGVLRLRGLQSTYLDPKKDGWLKTEDVGNIVDGYLKIVGRKDQVIKLGGELVNMLKLNHILARILEELKCSPQAYLLATDSERLGKEINLVIHTSLYPMSEVIREHFNEAVAPYERLKGIHAIEDWPTTELGKVREGELKRLIRAN